MTSGADESTDAMAETQALVRRTLEMWQQQWVATLRDPEAMRDLDSLAQPSGSFIAGAMAAMNAFMRRAGTQESPVGSMFDDILKTGAKAAGFASADGGNTSADLALRMAALEARVGELESRIVLLTAKPARSASAGRARTKATTDKPRGRKPPDTPPLRPTPRRRPRR